MPLNGFPPIKKFNIKNVKINSVRVKMKIIILIERSNSDDLDIFYKDPESLKNFSGHYLFKNY